MRKLLLLTALLVIPYVGFSQSAPFKFAYLSDLHISEGSPHIDNLNACIDDINSRKEVNFVFFGGDITEFGSDKEISLAKKLIDRLEVPYYVLAGNHDAKWSESGCNTFAKVFGYETVDFVKNGIRFLGCNSGPNMRMAPALMPHEALVWLDSISTAIPPSQPVIFVNHYPQDTSMLNYFQVVDALKKTNIQLIVGGHWHTNRVLEYMGVPGILGRSPDANKTREVGYNIFTIADGKITVNEKYVSENEPLPAWYELPLTATPRHDAPAVLSDNPYGLPEDFPWMTFAVNQEYPQIQEVWRVQDESDIGSGAIISGKSVIYANTQGKIKAISAETGAPIWEYATGGKIFSTPATDGSRVVVGSCDTFIYCFDIRNGKVLWRFKCDKSVLASPTIFNGKCYIGASDGTFRAIDMKSGSLVWRYNKVAGFVEDKAYVDKDYVVFGDWANTLYCLDTKTGKEKWTWKTKGSRMYSNAAVWPARVGNAIYITTPERKTYCIDIRNGITAWSETGGRESIGTSATMDKIFVKTMFSSLIAFNADMAAAKKAWEVKTDLGYDIAPTPTASYIDNKTKKEYLYVPTDKGNVFCFDASNGSLVWVHKISVALINSIVPLKDGKLLVSTMDGVVTILK